MKIGEECKFWQESFWFTSINQLNRQKRTCSRNYKSFCNLSFVIKPLNGNIFWPLWWKCMLPWRDIRKGGLAKIKNKSWWDIMIQYNTLQIRNSLGHKFSYWDSRNETLITHYEKKNKKNTLNVSYLEKIMSHWEYVY